MSLLCPRNRNSLRVVLVTRGCDHTTWYCGQHYSELRIEFIDGELWRQLSPREGLLPDDDDRKILSVLCYC